MQSLDMLSSDIIKFHVAKIKGGWIKQHPVAESVHFADIFCQGTKEDPKRKACQELLNWFFTVR